MQESLNVKSLGTVALIASLLAAPCAAFADMHYEFRIELGGGSSSGFETTVHPDRVVLVGAWDDGKDSPIAGSPFSRFPQVGRGGGGAKSTLGRIDDPTKTGTGCSLTQNVSGYTGLPTMAKNWTYFIDASTPRVMQAAFRDNFDLINLDQQARGSTFRFEETSDIFAAHLFISPPGGAAPKLREGDIATTHMRQNRNGSIRTSWTVVTNAPITVALANTVAAHEIGHTVGLDDNAGIDDGTSNKPDPNYPTVMFYAPGSIAGQKMDPCTLAGIDADVHQGKMQ